MERRIRGGLEFLEFEECSAEVQEFWGDLEGIGKAIGRLSRRSGPPFWSIWLGVSEVRFPGSTSIRTSVAGRPRW